ncbi:squalene-associated FAD-dependent desaturase [Chthonomonas calidirosea]|uniref:Squalene-associated FAD-dependent desaturase n=1 Tax=Chthonomonas calidirosea (strain DSM 23976 / ICMP 18418 / T49) TaxID=1303518 RepID=S0EUT5_CHTCT|nr:squalene-associated FAD-dependent desaturase [Chthonomonas calidirosea T49]CEK20850.1 squalene-associated FAD-dependent desaturase [Chthonomonas calidirosea]
MHDSGDSHSRAKSVLVIGGGVAGIAASVVLADAGFRVLLLEKRPLLGGRASSFVDPIVGERVDECQHGTMRCCTNLADLLERLGVHQQIDYCDTLEFLEPNGRRSVLRGSPLPAPLHTLPSFLRFRALSLRDKLGISYALLKILGTNPHRPLWEQQSFAAWLTSTHQTPTAIRRFWRPILVSACNEELERISCAHAFFLFQTGFLAHPKAFHFGIPKVPLASLYTEPTLDYLRQRGGCVRTKTTVKSIEVEGQRVKEVVLADGERLCADWYVSAVQCDQLGHLLPRDVIDSDTYWQKVLQIPLVPILGAHFWFDRPIACPKAVAVLDRRIEWIFHRSHNLGKDPQEGSCLSIVISASYPYETMEKEHLKSLLLEDLAACLPDVAKAQLVHWTLVRWPKATLSPAPGIEALRPPQKSPLSNLVVAGEWTQTGWPSTMEGAARSGYLAARIILNQEGLPCSLPVPDLPKTGLARWLLRERTKR